jgi:hypothetical protein
VAQSIADFFGNAKNRELVEKLRKGGVRFPKAEKITGLRRLNYCSKILLAVCIPTETCEEWIIGMLKTCKS